MSAEVMAQAQKSRLRRAWRAVRWPLGLGLASAGLVLLARAERGADHELLTWVLIAGAVGVMIGAWRTGR